MITFFTDESIADKGGAEEYKMSIYGGLILSELSFKELNKYVYQLKDRYVLPQQLEIKWNFEQYWKNMRKVGYLEKDVTKKTHPSLYESFREDHKKLKNQILEKVAATDLEIIVVIRPNKLLRATEEQEVKYSIAALARKFEKLLQAKNELGIMLADELEEKINPDAVIKYEYILELCSRGSGSVSFDRLISIVPTIYSHVSPIHQINDIVLGAIQFYILEFIRKLENPAKNVDVSKEILEKIVGKFLRSDRGSYVINNGILMYPPKVNRHNSAAGVFLNKLERQLKVDFGIL